MVGVFSSEKAPRSFRHPVNGHLYTQITLGEIYASDSEDEMISTVLGSCVAACIRDPVRNVGGMNHFLLPGADDRQAGLRYGVNAMERLINALLGMGAVRSRLEAKLFGGANVTRSRQPVGWLNADFAENFLRQEGISHVGGDLRGACPRRIEYSPVSGRVRVMAVTSNPDRVAQHEASEAFNIGRSKGEMCDVELF